MLQRLENKKNDKSKQILCTHTLLHLLKNLKITRGSARTLAAEPRKSGTAQCAWRSTDPRGGTAKVRRSRAQSRLNELELVLLVLALTNYILRQIATVANTTTHTVAAAATTANTAVIDASAAVGPNIHKHTPPEAHPSTGPPTHFPAHNLPIYDTTTAFHHNHRHQLGA